MTLKTITIIGYNRPQYFEQLLHVLVCNDLQNWKIYIQLEPSNQSTQFIKLADRILQKHQYSIEINNTILGIRHNPFSLLKKVFELGSELNIHLEEDLLVSPDVTYLANWYKDIDVSNIMCLNLMLGGCSSGGFISNETYPSFLIETKCFNSLGLIITRNQWKNYFEHNWLRYPKFFTNFHGEQTDGWDLAMWDFLLSNKDLKVLAPLYARATHNGENGGTYCKKNFHQKSFKNLPVYFGPLNSFEYSINKNVEELPFSIKAHLNLWEDFHDTLLALKKMQKKVSCVENSK